MLYTSIAKIDLLDKYNQNKYKLLIKMYMHSQLELTSVRCFP